MGMIDNSGLYRDGKFHGGEIVLLDKVSVNARDICTAINQCLGVNDFHWIWRNYWCYNTIGTYFLLNRLSTFSLVHLILLQHVIILSQDMLSFIYFLTRSTISLMLSQPSFNFHAVHGYAFFSSLPFWCLTHHTCSCFHSMHSPGFRVFLMHSVLVESIQSCTNIMNDI